MRLTIAYSKIKSKLNLVLINNATHQRETVEEWPIRLPLNETERNLSIEAVTTWPWEIFFDISPWKMEITDVKGVHLFSSMSLRLQHSTPYNRVDSMHVFRSAFW